MRAMLPAAIVMAFLLSSCEQKGVTEPETPSTNETVEISINGIEAYRENHLNSPQEMDEMMGEVIDGLANSENLHFDIELRYLMENADKVLIDSYLVIYYRNPDPQNKPFALIAVANQPDDDAVKGPTLPPQPNIHKEVIREHYRGAFDEWWHQKQMAEQDVVK